MWEGLFLELRNSITDEKICISNIYKPPRNNNNNENISNFLNEFSPCINFLNTYDYSIISGDFNIDLLKINQREAYSNYFDELVNNGYLPTITGPTRFSNSNATLLDHIFVRSPNEHRHNFACILTTKIFDHLATFCNVPFDTNHKPKPKYVTEYNDSASNTAKVISELSNIDWSSLLQTDIASDPSPIIKYSLRNL